MAIREGDRRGKRRPAQLWIWIYGLIIIPLATFWYVTGRFRGFVEDIPLDGPYRLVALKTSEDMALCRSIGPQGLRGRWPTRTNDISGWVQRRLHSPCSPSASLAGTSQPLNLGILLCHPHIV
jgi:hypothetical protein